MPIIQLALPPETPDYRDVNTIDLTDVAVVDPPDVATIIVAGYAPNSPREGDVYIALADAFGTRARINVTPDTADQIAALLIAQAEEARR